MSLLDFENAFAWVGFTKNSLEELKDATYEVLRYDYFDVNKLDEIESQIKQLNLSETLMFCILKTGIKATHFYWDNSVMGYSTSFEPTVHLSSYSSNQFDNYLKSETPNYPWHGMYITGFKALDSHLIVQHNDPLTEDEIATISFLVDVSNERYKDEMNSWNKLINEFQSWIDKGQSLICPFL